jgi:hypothetical protein
MNKIATHPKNICQFSRELNERKIFEQSSTEFRSLCTERFANPVSHSCAVVVWRGGSYQLQLQKAFFSAVTRVIGMVKVILSRVRTFSSFNTSLSFR